MEFEFDPKKSEANREKHGIDFDAAKALWLDMNAVEIPARSEFETRKMLIAGYDGKVWSVIFTERGNKVRLISVRRARKNEEDLYEK
jgi:uncharacterized DUF497 family protein